METEEKKETTEQNSVDKPDVQAAETQPAEAQEKQQQIAAPEIDDNKFFEYASTKLGKKVEKLEDLVEVREIEKQIENDDDEFTSSYKKFKKETGRSIHDFMKYNQDINEISEEDRIKDYMKTQYPGLDDEDISYKLSKLKRDILSEEEGYDESEIERSREAKLNYKIMLSQANQYAASQKEKYAIPVKETVEDTTNYAEIAAQFENDIRNTAKGFKFEFDDFKYELQTNPEKYKTPETFLRFFEKDGIFDYKKIVEAVEFISNKDAILKSMKDHVIAQYMDEDLKRKNNAGTIEKQAPEGTQYLGLERLKRTSFF